MDQEQKVLELVKQVQLTDVQHVLLDIITTQLAQRHVVDAQPEHIQVKLVKQLVQHVKMDTIVQEAKIE